MERKKIKAHVIKNARPCINYTFFVKGNKVLFECSLHKELEEAQRIVDEQMLRYEIYLNQMMHNYMAKPVIEVTDKDTEYFIKRYKKKFAHNSLDNIKRRRKLYEKLLEKNN